MKKCNKCLIEKLESEFRVRKDKRQGPEYRCMSSRCKECERQQKLEYYALNKHQINKKNSEKVKSDRRRNPEKYRSKARAKYHRNKEVILRQQKAYYERNKAKIHERGKKYLIAHPEVRKKALTNYYKKNKEKINKTSREWQKNNPDKALAIQKNHRQKYKKKYCAKSQAYYRENSDAVKEYAKNRYQNKKPELMRDHVKREAVRRKEIGNSYLKKLLREQKVAEAALNDNDYLELRRMLLKVKRKLKK